MSNQEILILHSIGKFGFLLSRHILQLTGISSKRSLYRKLKRLLDEKYIEKRRILYGVPSLYTLAHKGRMLLGLNKRAYTFKLEQIHHDITVIDVVVLIMKQENITIDKVISERELHSIDGFGTRKHHPDFVYYKDDKSYAVEIELSIKTLYRLEENIKLNYLNYDYQIWFIYKNNQKLKQNMESVLHNYANSSIFYLEVLGNDKY